MAATLYRLSIVVYVVCSIVVGNLNIIYVHLCLSLQGLTAAKLELTDRAGSMFTLNSTNSRDRHTKTVKKSATVPTEFVLCIVSLALIKINPGGR